MLQWAFIAVACLAIFAPGRVSAESRVALVIGNSAYVHTSPLSNPRNDAKLVADTLQQVGFSVTRVFDADQPTMKRALVEFGRLLRGSDAVGLFYYSGHGVQVKNENYLIPTDANIGDESEVPIAAVDLNEFLATMERAQSRINIVIIDACRNNPFPSSGRSGTRGLARVDAPSGTFIAYATAPGQVALDGDPGGNSPYARALTGAIITPGVAIEEAFKRTRKRVQEDTQSRQTPWETSSITGDFFFVGTPNVSETTSTPLVSPPASDQSADIAFWNSIKDSNELQSYRYYLEQFPNGVFAKLARLKLEEQPQPSETAANKAMAVAQDYMRAWSLPNADALAFLEGLYPPKLTYYGKVTSKAAVMKLKKDFAQRWPERGYTIRPGTATTSCSESSCTVSGIVDWRARSDTRNVTSTGAARFQIVIATGERPVLLSESGEVLTRESNSGR